MRYDGEPSAARRQVDLPRGRARAVVGGLAAVLGTMTLVGALAGCSVPDASLTSAGPVELAGSAPGSPPPADATQTPDPSAEPAGQGADGGLARAVRTPVAVPVPSLSAQASARAAAARTATQARSAAQRLATRSAPAKKSPTAPASAGTRTPGPAAGAAPLLLGAGAPSTAEAEVIRLVNVQRADAGCPAVVADPTLVRLARAHSQDMAGAAGFKHNGSDGRTPFQRMTAAGYDYSVAAENIAAGQPNAGAVMAAWTASPGHRANIVDCRFTQVGVGVVNVPGTPYVVYWTQEFAAPL